MTKTAVVDTDLDRLIDTFKQGPLRLWTREDIAIDKLMRFAQTYLMMARAGYRPAAPSDGCGNIQLSQVEFDDSDGLYREAVKYAIEFCREEDDLRFRIGCSDYATNRAFKLADEWQRCSCAFPSSLRMTQRRAKRFDIPGGGERQHSGCRPPSERGFVGKL